MCSAGFRVRSGATTSRSHKESDVQLDHLSFPGVVMPRNLAGLPASLLHMASPSQLSP